MGTVSKLTKVDVPVGHEVDDAEIQNFHVKDGEPQNEKVKLTAQRTETQDTRTDASFEECHLN